MRFSCLVVMLLFAMQPLLAAEPLRVTMTGAYRPFSSPDSSGELVGFDVDIAREISRRLGRPLELIQVKWEGLPAHLQSGKSDLICGSMAVTPERQELMSFSLPYYVSGAQVFVRDGVSSLNDLRIGVTRGTTFERYIREHPQTFPRAEVLSFESEAHILAALQADKVDALISDRIIGGFYIQKARESGSDVRILPFGDLLYTEECGIAARQADIELVHGVNAALIGMVNDGRYADIYRHWVDLEPDMGRLREAWGRHTAFVPKLRQHAEFEPDSPNQQRAAYAEDTRSMVSLMLTGAWLTAKLSSISALAALLLGSLLAVACVSRRPWLSLIGNGYIWVIRGTPLLVQLFLSYYAVSWAINSLVGRELVSAFGAALIALIVNTSAYNAESLRGAIRSLPRGQWEASLSLGISYSATMRRTILPQAFQASIASLGNNLVILIKDTSLVGAITLVELTYSAQNIVTQSGQPFAPFMIAALMYLTIISLVTLLTRITERWLSRHQVGLAT